MQIELLFFGALREALQRGHERESLELPNSCTRVADLLGHLRARGGTWAKELANGQHFRVAVQQQVVAEDALLVPGCEVAIFSRVTGG